MKVGRQKIPGDNDPTSEKHNHFPAKRGLKHSSSNLSKKEILITSKIKNNAFIYCRGNTTR